MLFMTRSALLQPTTAGTSISSIKSSLSFVLAQHSALVQRSAAQFLFHGYAGEATTMCQSGQDGFSGEVRVCLRQFHSHVFKSCGAKPV
jgi:hypothetical protein